MGTFGGIDRLCVCDGCEARAQLWWQEGSQQQIVPGSCFCTISEVFCDYSGWRVCPSCPKGDLCPACPLETECEHCGMTLNWQPASTEDRIRVFSSERIMLDVE